MKRLAKMLIGTPLAVLALLMPAATANADDDYLLDMSIDENLAVHGSMNVRIPELPLFLDDDDLSCEQLETEPQYLPAEITGLDNFTMESCEQRGNVLHIDFSGQAKESNEFNQGWKITEDEIILSFPPGISGKTAFEDSDSASSIGGIRITFPGNVKTVEPGFGNTYDNTWSIDSANDIDSSVTITAERHASILGTSGMIILGLLVIVAIIAAVIVANNRKPQPKDSDKPKQAYGSYPPPLSVPENPASTVSNESETHSPEPNRGGTP